MFERDDDNGHGNLVKCELNKIPETWIIHE